MRKLLSGKYLVFLLLIFFCSVKGQTSDSIHTKKQELDKIKKDITELEKELQVKSKKERESLQSLENINKQNLLIGILINNIHAEEKIKENSIQQIESEIGIIENKSADLKAQYSRYIVWIYKNRGISFWRFVLDAKSFNQAVKRYQYLKYISEKNANTLDKLLVSKTQLNDLMINLEQEKNEKEILAKQKMNEQEELQRKETEKKELLGRLKKDQKLITQEISSKRKAEIVIKNLVAQLIEIDRERRAKFHEQKASDKKGITYQKNEQNFDYSAFENFVQLKGKLGWPIRGGKIVRNFGENKNERLNTVTLNYGIDISVKGEQNVLAVAEGIVSAIDWIPGYGSIVIVTHRGEFRTVYGHVANIAVKEGDRIKGGSPIGRVNESLEGNILHFEIWNERNYQNPELWLARK
jgi:septal ring factor EnvC (AmiA/AmiB activator)